MWTVRKVIIYLSVAGLVGICLVILSARMTGELLPKFTETLGLAFIVSWIVGIIMELYLRGQMKLQMSRMMTEISTDVFKESLGHDFPECIWQQVTAHLLLNQFIRKDLTIDCNITELKGGTSDFIKMQMCISYTLINLNGIQKSQYPFACSVDRCTHPELKDKTEFKSIRIGDDNIPLEECRQDASDTEITCQKIIELGPGEERQITIRTESAYRNHETIPFSLTDPTENFTISFSKPPDISVAVDTLHPREERLIEEPTASPESQRRWRISGGLLPGNGVSIRWFPS